jgi:hypothetical protein
MPERPANLRIVCTQRVVEAQGGFPKPECSFKRLVTPRNAYWKWLASGQGEERDYSPKERAFSDATFCRYRETPAGIAGVDSAVDDSVMRFLKWA